MTFDQLLNNVISNAEAHRQRAELAAAPLNSHQFNKPSGRDWSVAHVFKHLCLADGPYLHAIDKAITLARPTAGESKVRHTLIGKMLMKASGPNGNAPAPGFLIPPPLPLSKEVMEEWTQKKAKLVELAEFAKGKDLSMRVRNPFIRLITLSLADMFAIVDAHTERHVRQIEERAKLAQ